VAGLSRSVSLYDDEQHELSGVARINEATSRTDARTSVRSPQPDGARSAGHRQRRQPLVAGGHLDLGADLRAFCDDQNRRAQLAVDDGGVPDLEARRGRDDAADRLKKWGLESDVKFLATGGYIESVAALEKRRVHAAVLDPPRAYIGRKRFGFNELANLGQEFKYATTVIVARESQLRKERETFSQFAKAVIQGIHRVKTDREFAIKILGKMLRSSDREILDETYKVFAALYERVPYPAPEGIQPILDEISLQYPKAKNYKPDDFIDTSIVKQLEESGFVESVYR
jgi:hypothetical protein